MFGLPGEARRSEVPERSSEVSQSRTEDKTEKEKEIMAQMSSIRPVNVRCLVLGNGEWEGLNVGRIRGSEI